tara:strand:+ start:3230 stop:4168 length:939 start_codon:yes stop_codon:yes gene_type:complete
MAKSSARKAVGVTTWIKSTVCRGIPFTRVGCAGMGNATKGASLGRKVDAGFKTLCTTGSMPRDSAHWLIKRLTCIQSTLKKAGVDLVDANKFVKLGALKTHIDGIGRTADGSLVVLELKCTQASLQNHRNAYDVPCSVLPMIQLGPQKAANTERMHHQLQLNFGMRALGGGCRHGFVVVSASDGAVIYRATTGIPAEVYTQAAPIALVRRPPRRAGGKKSQKRAKKGFRWPGAAVALRGTGWVDAARVTLCVALLRDARTGRLGLATATKGGSGDFEAAKRRLRVAELAVDEPIVDRMVVMPGRLAWKCYCV